MPGLLLWESEVIRVSSALTAQQELFCEEYLTDLNGTQAAIRAGYSAKTAAATASRLLRNVNIQAHIQKRMDEKQDTLIAKQDEVLQTLTRILRREESENVVVTVKKHKSGYDEDGRKKIEDSEEPIIVPIPVKISDVNKAADMLGRYYALFTDRTQVEGDGVVQIIDNIPRESNDES